MQSIRIAAAVWIVGLASLLCEHFQTTAPLIIGMRALFGILTCTAISLVLIQGARALRSAGEPDLYLFTRLVSRWVYILMYGLALVRVCLYLYEANQHCELCAAPGHSAPVRSLDDFQFYIACTLLPLWLVRALVLAAPFKGCQGLLKRLRSRNWGARWPAVVAIGKAAASSVQRGSRER